MTKFALRKEQHKAEILQASKCVMSHFSFNSPTDITDIIKDSSTDITDIIKALFADSALA